MNIREKIESNLRDALQKMGVSSSHIVEVKEPKEPSHGEYSTNIPFRLAKKMKSSPEKIAEKVLSNCEFESGLFEKVEIATPGFINFILSWKTLRGELLEVLKAGEGYGRVDLGNGEKVLVEFVSANPTGPLVVANARAAAIGDSLVRLLNFLGFEAKSDFYVDDGGTQVKLLGKSLEHRFRELLGEEVTFPQDGYSGEYIREMAGEWISKKDKLLTLSEEERVEELKSWGVREILDGQKKSLERYGVHFDQWSHESHFRKEGKATQVVEDLKRKGSTFDEGGALWFRATNFGDDRDRVLMKSNGELTYLVPDLAYHVDKFKRGFSRLINLFGPDHLAHSPSLIAGLKALEYPSEKLEILVIQWVTLLRSGKKIGMSKRAGEFITMEELLDEIGVDAARFLLQMRKPSSHLDFDIDEAKKQSDENPVYYVQYGHARISSILQYADEQGFQIQSAESLPAGRQGSEIEVLKEPEERALIRKMRTFPEVLLECGNELSPHSIPYYLFDLATLFHHFYQKHRVVSELSEEKPLTQARLQLIRGVQIVLQNGLSLIGVSAPEKM
jgi:arginyl-tRNA synthetase